MPAIDPGTAELTASGARRHAPVSGDTVPVRLGGGSHADATDPPTSAQGGGSTLALVALVLGIAATALGVAVVWYLAAIVIGVAAVVVGTVALRRVRTEADHRNRSRAVVGTMLGAIAVVLGVSAAILLPDAIGRVDSFFASVQDEVNHNVNVVNRGLQADVNRVDRTTSRDLRRLERQNREDLSQLENRENKSLLELSGRISGVESRLSDAERKDLARLETSLRGDINRLDDALHSSSGTLSERIATLDARLAELERIVRGG